MNRLWLQFVLVLCVLSACTSKKTPSPASDADPTAETKTAPAQPGDMVAAAAQSQTENRAKEIFVERCVSCHGTGGRGDGKRAPRLKVPPGDLASPAWQDSVSDERIDKVIVGGGAAIGKSPRMPANPDLRRKPEVVAALREFVRGLRE